jgi:hypothetical protein
MKIINIDNTLKNADWTKIAWDLPFASLNGFFANIGITDAASQKQQKELQHFMELPAYQAAPSSFKKEAEAFMSDTTKAIKPELTIEPTAGVPSSLEVARALSRLEILPNPDDPAIGNIEKFVESPWETVPTPSVNPNVWDEAKVTLLKLADLFGTDPYLRRKTVRKHIEAMGQALTPRRSYALVINIAGKNIIIDGHHRLMALWLLGLDEAPVWLVKE